MRPKRRAAALVQRRHCAMTPGRLLVSLLGAKAGVRAASQHGASSTAGRTHLKAEAGRSLTQPDAALRPQESCREAGGAADREMATRSCCLCRVDPRLGKAPNKSWKLVVKR